MWRTFAALLARPGTLTRVHNAGQRQRFLSPLRVYLTSTLLFFFLLSAIDPVGHTRAGVPLGPEGPADSLTVAALVDSTDAWLELDQDSISTASVARARAHADSAVRAAVSRADSPERIAKLRADGLEAVAEAQHDARDDAAEARDGAKRYRLERAILATLPPDSLVFADDIRGAVNMVYPDSVGSFKINGVSIRKGMVGDIIGARTKAEQMDAIVAFIKVVIGHIPTVLFLILPIFASLLKLLYVRRDWFFSEHVVFGLHTHAFAFIAFSAIVLVTWGFGESHAFVAYVAVALALSIPLYFLVALKRVYGQSWRKTVAKALVLGTVYNGVLIAGIVVAVVLAAMMG